MNSPDRSIVPCPVHPHEAQLDVVYRGASGRSHKKAKVLGCGHCVRSMITGKNAVPLFWADGRQVQLAELPAEPVTAPTEPVLVRAATAEEPGFSIPPRPAPPATESSMKTCQVPGHQDRKAVAHGRCATCAAIALKGGWSSLSPLLDVERHHTWLRTRDNAGARASLKRLEDKGELLPPPERGVDTWVDLHWWAQWPQPKTDSPPPVAIEEESSRAPAETQRDEGVAGSDGAGDQGLQEAASLPDEALGGPLPEEQATSLPPEVLADLALGGEPPRLWSVPAPFEEARPVELSDLLEQRNQELQGEISRLRVQLRKTSERLAASELCRRMEAEPRKGHDEDASWDLLRSVLAQVAAGRVPLSALIDASYGDRRSA